MYRFLSSTPGRATAASLAALMLAGPLGPAATALAAPVIDRSQPAPTPNADPDPFYTPPATIPAGEPGDIIRARPAKAGPPTARKLANAWQVMYLSTNALGERDVVTGTILVPKSGTAANAPLVTFAPGTTGPAFRCTVSRFINSGAFYEQAAVNDMLKAGYAIAVTDYEGYHENPETTYVVGRSMGPAVLDAARAATRLPEAGLAAKPKIAIRGYSQGGGGALWAGELAKTYAPELDLVGVAAGGVPANLANVGLNIEGKKAFGVEMTALIGLDNAYPELKLADYLLPEAAPVFANLEANDCTIEIFSDYAGKRAVDYTDPSPLGTIPWLTRIDENALGRQKISVPVLDYHASDDQVVDFRQALALRTKYCALGMDLQWRTYLGGHITNVGRPNPDVLAWLGDRFANRPSQPNC